MVYYANLHLIHAAHALTALVGKIKTALRGGRENDCPAALCAREEVYTVVFSSELAAHFMAISGHSKRDTRQRFQSRSHGCSESIRAFFIDGDNRHRLG